MLNRKTQSRPQTHNGLHFALYLLFSHFKLEACKTLWCTHPQICYTAIDDDIFGEECDSNQMEEAFL